jgi:colanic acid biosynthesis glycosyl transferase WcaI
MKILIYSMNFMPEKIGIGKYSGEMAEWLVSNGHEVRVVCSQPYYPNWQVFSGFSRAWYSSSVESFGVNSLTVFRCPLWIPKEPNGLKRLLYLMGFALTSAPRILSQCFWRPDVLIVIEPPLMCAPIALLSARLANAKSILHIQDLEVDAAFDLGILKGAWLKNRVLDLERFLITRFDLVSTISNRMAQKVLDKGVNSKKLVLFPNWVSVEGMLSIEHSHQIDSKSKNSYREKLGIPNDAVIALYSGSMGAKQGLEILGEVARYFDKTNNPAIAVHFVFCGDGIGRKKLEKQCRGLHFVHFLDLQPAEFLSHFLKMADIHLLPQRADAADLVMPSKLTGMLASGRPIIACAQMNTELAMVVEGRGLVVPPEDRHAFVTALEMLILDESLRKNFGLAALEYAVTSLDRGVILREFESKLKSMI